MIIQFDPKIMHIQVLCGILENYAPSENIVSIQKKVEDLKVEMTKFRDETLDPKLKEIEALVAQENKKFTPEKK